MIGHDKQSTTVSKMKSQYLRSHADPETHVQSPELQYVILVGVAQGVGEAAVDHLTEGPHRVDERQSIQHGHLRMMLQV